MRYSHEPLLRSAADRSIRYLGNLGQRPVAPAPEDVRRLERLAGELPADPADPETVLGLLDEIGSPATVATAGGRYFGFVVGGALPVTVAANWLAAAWDQLAGMVVQSPVAAFLEETVQGWLADVLGLPPETGAGFVSGDTMANFAALAAARHALLARAGWDVEAQGLYGAPPITVIVSDETHISVLKCLAMLGLGRERVVRVPVDAQGRMCAGDLPRIAGPAIVCLQAGNVNTGSFDPAEQVVAAAHEAGAWVHEDGAFGLWAAAAPGRAHLVRGFAQADSW
ncbi:MAG: aspartate aminotransferase family protein, partial [Acidobacteria bacterium]|nr:aspartate aminotransferase family protein [Acidobacteriota bacterium]